MDIGDILKSYGEGYSYEEFNAVGKALKEVRKQLSKLSQNSDYRQYNAWGDICDELIDEIKEKVAEIDKRTKERGGSRCNFYMVISLALLFYPTIL